MPLIEDLIRRAFALEARPPAGTLSASAEGDEGPLLEADFKDKADWRALDAAFLDQAPGGYASALSFFSPEALRYFLPAYLLADLAGQLDRVEPVAALCLGFSSAARSQLVNQRRFGQLTRFESAARRFSILSRDQACAVVAYLEQKAKTAEGPDAALIAEALANHWRPRCNGG